MNLQWIAVLTGAGRAPRLSRYPKRVGGRSGGEIVREITTAATSGAIACTTRGATAVPTNVTLQSPQTPEVEQSASRVSCGCPGSVFTGI